MIEINCQYAILYYKPLKRPGKQIRLLHFLPDNEDDEISCTSSVRDLDSLCQAYSAISYTWGDARPKFGITIDGFQFRVGQNCWYALWQMRFHGLGNIFWIDAICIDQNNDAEKGSQLPMMGQIFGNDDCVAACLGPGNELIRRDFGILATKPYFSRLWIKQEFLLAAKSIILFCGLDYADIQDLEGAFPGKAAEDSDRHSSGNPSDMGILLNDRFSGLSARASPMRAIQDGLKYYDILAKLID